MVCGGSTVIRKQIASLDMNCVMQDVAQGGYQQKRKQSKDAALVGCKQAQAQREEIASPDAAAGGSQVRTPARVGNVRSLSGLLDPDAKRALLHMVGLKASKWMYTAEYGRNIEPPQATSFALSNGQVLSVGFAPLQVTLSDEWVQEQFAILMVTVEGRSLVPPLRVLVLAFRGTARAQDVLGNISPLVNEQAFARYGLHVHAAWHSLVSPQRHLELLWATLNSAAELGASELLITGHSMGGALGQISVLQILAKLDQKESMNLGCGGNLTLSAQQLLHSVTCVTFGAPMPFAPEAPERLSVPMLHAQLIALQWMAERILNYVNNNDVVPRLPGCLQFLRDVLKTVRPVALAYKFGHVLLDGSPVIRRYRPVSRVSLIGHGEVAVGHPRLGLDPTDPESARALMAKYGSDKWHASCPFRGALTWCRFAGYVTGDGFYAVQDHLMERYEGYVLTALGVKELGPRTLAHKMGYLNSRFRLLKDGPPIMSDTKSARSGESQAELTAAGGAQGQRTIRRANSF